MNYQSVNEIFSAGLTNMTCLFQNSDSYDEGTYAVAGVDFFSFMGKSASKIYAHGNSCWGIGEDVTHLKINFRDSRMRSLYREEGTLLGYYRFLKIRWEGWSKYNQSGESYQIKYDLIFWDTGGISLHMAAIPTLCYDGDFEFIADKSYALTKPTADAPDITIQKNPAADNFIVNYSLIDLDVPFRILVRDASGVIYTVESAPDSSDTAEALVPIVETELSAELFKTYGFEFLPSWEQIKQLDTPTVLSWSALREFPILAVITGTPPPQYVECAADLSDETVLGIKALNASCSGDISVQYSYDGETFSEKSVMADFLTSDTDALYSGLTDDKKIIFRFWLSGDATLESFVMTYRNGDDDNG